MKGTRGTIDTIETSNVPIVDLPQAMPSVAGSAGGEPISHTTELQLQYTLTQPQMTPAAMPQMAFLREAMPQAAMQQAPPMQPQAAMQPVAMQMTAIP